MKTKLVVDRNISPLARRAAPVCAARNDRPMRSALKLRRIMVPIDFTGCSRKALHYAVSLARDYRAGVVLVHVVKDALPTGQLLKDREAELEALAGREIGADVPAATLIRVGEPLREIIDLAKAELADLLVISTHARTGLPDFCLGSAAEQIVRYAPCPVLVVREQERDFLRERRASRDAPARRE